MNVKTITISCGDNYPGTCRLNPFRVVCYTFSYTEGNDIDFIDRVIMKANVMKDRVNSGTANDSEHSRPQNVVLSNCIAGILSEYCWYNYLNTDWSSNLRSKVVDYTEFQSATNQIDLRIVANDKKIEVRSSFPRNGIDFAICHPKYEFDILGPYANNYKPGEISKDYYVRALFVMRNPTDIISLVKEREFNVYLTGGATHKMMWDPQLSINKSLIPEDSFVSEQTSYRVVPFHNALDTIEIYNMIRNGI